jgi:hypothetical protein
MKRRKKNIQQKKRTPPYFQQQSLTQGPAVGCVFFGGRVSLPTREKRRSAALVFFFMPSRGKTNEWARNFHLLNVAGALYSGKFVVCDQQQMRQGKNKNNGLHQICKQVKEEYGQVFFGSTLNRFLNKTRGFTPNCAIAICKL